MVTPFQVGLPPVSPYIRVGSGLYLRQITLTLCAQYLVNPPMDPAVGGYYMQANHAQGQAIHQPMNGMAGVPLAAVGALGGVGVFATPLVGSISPVPVHTSAALGSNGSGTPAGSANLASPAPSLGGAGSRFSGLAPFGAGEEDGSRPATGGAQPTRNLFIGNVSVRFIVV